MDRIKRQQNDTIQDYHNNKKRKLHNETTIIKRNKSIFENLANEILYEIFEYLEIYHVYDGFANLNTRFRNLFFNSNLPMQIIISSMTKSTFEHYNKNIILPNKHRINFLRLSNPFTVDIIFSPPRIINKFLQLETLILDNTKAKYLDKILDYLTLLPKLHSLVLTLADYVRYPSILFSQIFRLCKLKSCKLTYQTKDDQDPSSIFFSEYDCSPIEYLVINSRFPINSFDDLLFCLPQLRHLSINCLVVCRFEVMDEKLGPVVLKNLKFVSLNLNTVRFNRFEIFIKNFFQRVEILRLTTKYDPGYLDAKKWEQLILSYMPNLRVFDINHVGCLRTSPVTYHDLVNQFNSLFWTKRQWFFTHQHDWQESLDSGLFYSTDPYRRKDYTFYWDLDKQLCPHVQETNLNSVKHLRICGKRAAVNCINYFPNATELTIKHYFQVLDGSIAATLNRMIPLTQLTKLEIECYDIPFEQVLNLIRFTPVLHTLSLHLYCLNENTLRLIEGSEDFKYVSNTNKITNLNLRGYITFIKIQSIINLFPRLECLQTTIKRNEMTQITRFLLSKSNQKTRRLYFLCILDTPKICLRELNVLIKLENLVGDYSIKFVNRDLYLWW